MTESVKTEYKKAVLHAIAYHFPEAKVFLFGSRARGTHKSGADIDIAIDAGSAIRLAEMGRIRNTMENLPIPLEVDVVDMHNIPETLRALILREGVVWKS